MPCKFTAVLFIGGLLRLGDTATSIAYFLTEDFFSDLFYWLCLGFLLTGTLTTFLFITLCNIFSKEMSSKLTFFSILLGIFMIIGEQFGLISILLSSFYMFKKIGAERDIVISTLRRTSAVYAIFESIPQVIIQTYNSGLLYQTGILLICSCVLSGLCILFSACRVTYLLDENNIIEKVTELAPAIRYLEKEEWGITNTTLEKNK